MKGRSRPGHVGARIARENEEDRTRVAVAQAGANTTASPRAPVDEEELIGEIYKEALLVACPQISWATQDRDCSDLHQQILPENLYNLRHLKKREDKDRDENIIIEYGRMKLKRVTGSLRDFGSTWDTWLESFLNYITITVDLFMAPVCICYFTAR